MLWVICPKDLTANNPMIHYFSWLCVRRRIGHCKNVTFAHLSWRFCRALRHTVAEFKWVSKRNTLWMAPHLSQKHHCKQKPKQTSLRLRQSKWQRSLRHVPLSEDLRRFDLRACITGRLFWAYCLGFVLMALFWQRVKSWGRFWLQETHCGKWLWQWSHMFQTGHGFIKLKCL